MPLERYPQAGYELLTDHDPIWRFMKIRTFTRFIESGGLYFNRADLFEDDEYEGLPLEDYVKHVVAKMGPGHSFDYTWETLKQDRQGTFISCWSLDESLHMWRKFAMQGVALRTDCGLLKAALDAIPARTMVGRVRYSLAHEGFNILRFVTAKRPDYAQEKEVRAIVWDMQHGPRNPYPHDTPNGLLYSVDVPTLVRAVIASPFAPTSVFDEVQELMRKHGYSSIPVVASAFKAYDHLLPSADDIVKYSEAKMK